MTKQIIVFLLIALVALAQHPRFINRQNEKGHPYSNISRQDAKALLESEEFKTILKFVNQHWFAEFKEGLGSVVGVERHVDSGLSYKIAFKPEHMRADHLAVVVVKVDTANNNKLEVVSSEVVKRGNPSENSFHSRN